MAAQRRMAGRVPQVMQMESAECGAACLAMICAYHGKWVPLETVRAECGVGRDGSKASGIARAAQGYGLEVKAYRYSLERFKEAAQFPCIVHWNMFHFVVIRGFKGNRVYVNDPSLGEYSCSWDAFSSSFTGVCLCMRPGPAFEPSGSKRRLGSFARKHLAGAGSALAFVAFTTLLTAAVNLMNPTLSQVFVNRLLGQSDPGWTLPFMLVLAGVCAVQVTASALSATYLLKVEGKLDVSAAAAYFWKALRLPLEFYLQRSVSDVSARLNTTALISQRLVGLLAPLAINALMLAVYAVIMLCYSPLLALVGIAAMAVNLVCAQLLARKRTDISRVQARDKAKLDAATLAGIQTIETIKASGAEEGFFRTWAAYQAQHNAQQVRASRLSALLGSVPALASGLANAVVLVLGIQLVMSGEFNAGMLLAFQGFLAQFAAPAQQLVDSLQDLAQMRVDMERVEDVLEAPLAAAAPATSERAGGDPAPLRGELELRGVSFGYTRHAVPLIQDLCLKVEPGASVALVGASGSGKSTVAQLVAGLLEPWEGTVLVDGTPLFDLPRAQRCRGIAVISQECRLLPDSIRNNLTLWDSSIPEEDIRRALSDACLLEQVLGYPDGLGHMLAEGGANLSGGQRQRLQIARALVGNPRILVMDEATSALDAATEAQVMAAVKARGITLVIAAHRLSTIRDASEIVVFDRGAVIERGTHDSLMALGGAYARLVRQG